MTINKRTHFHITLQAELVSHYNLMIHELRKQNQYLLLLLETNRIDNAI